METSDESFWRKRQTTIQKEGDFFTSLVDHKIVLDWILFVIITCLSLYPGCLLNCLAFLLFSWRAKSMSIEISWTRSPCWGGDWRWESRGAEQEEQEEGIHDVWWWSGQVQGGDHQVVDVRLNLIQPPNGWGTDRTDSDGGDQKKQKLHQAASFLASSGISSNFATASFSVYSLCFSRWGVGAAQWFDFWYITSRSGCRPRLFVEWAKLGAFGLRGNIF